MNAHNFITVLNEEFEANKSKAHFVLLRKTTYSAVSKAYKEYEYTLYYIIGKSKYTVTTINHTARVVTDKEEENVQTYMAEQLLHRIFSLFQDTENYHKMLNGEFKGYEY